MNDAEVIFTEADVAVCAVALTVLIVVIFPMFIGVFVPAIVIMILGGGRVNNRCSKSNQKEEHS